MNTNVKSIKLIELTPYGSFPVGARQSSNADVQSLFASLSGYEADEAKFWFEADEVEVA